MSNTQQQLTLNVQLRDEATFDNFLGDERSEALLTLLHSQCGADGEPLIFLHGALDSGKTHLLQGACHHAGESAMYLPLAAFKQYAPAQVLSGVEQLSLLCLDDVESVVGDTQWEEALFHLYNRARDNGCRLLLAASAAPRNLEVKLPDLASRLGWGSCFT